MIDGRSERTSTEARGTLEKANTEIPYMDVKSFASFARSFSLATTPARHERTSNALGLIVPGGASMIEMMIGRRHSTRPGRRGAKREKKRRRTGGRKKLGGDEETAKNDNDETRGRRRREATKERGRRVRETGPR